MYSLQMSVTLPGSILKRISESILDGNPNRNLGKSMMKSCEKSVKKYRKKSFKEFWKKSLNEFWEKTQKKIQEKSRMKSLQNSRNNPPGISKANTEAGVHVCNKMKVMNIELNTVSK